ncbi:Ig-like domain-containing protein [Brevibacillus laterosporus]|uniref:Ig-like domain-containing protein n=1 Tax=Brevibacillus laterosporus TaxID=1465 RepID=UPI0024055B42|nr:Ig-like domain-containing protein [Brevibacillus laterosporus]
MAYVWEYVKAPYGSSTIDLVNTHKYKIKAVSSHSYGIRIYGTKRSNGQEDLLFSTKDYFMTPFNVSGALYSSVRIANDLTGGTTGVDLSATILVRMPIADNDRDNPYNVWEYIDLPYATRTVNIESTHKYRFTAYSSLSYGLRFYGVRRSDGKEQLLLETESTFDTLETSGALYSSIRISNMYGRETGLEMSGHLFLRMPLNSAPTLTLTANNQPLTENQRINIGTNDFTVIITANDADPDDTLQYQVKLNNVIKQDWTTIAKNQPISYTFKNADNVNDSNPFLVSVRDNNGVITTFEATLVKHEQPKYLGSVYLGTLRNITTVIPRPIRPWWSHKEPYEGAGTGDIASFKTDPVITNWNIGDTDVNMDNQLHWHKIIDGSKTLLICDRVILADITWNDLSSDNRIFGKTITIDGRQFKLRVLTVGSNYRGHPREGGLPKDNEWDRFITNEDAISGIPSPVKSDLDDLPLSSTDRYSPHNIFWNWMAIYSWGQEDASVGGKACRGERSARFWSNGFSYSRDDWRGWRPVLEVLNQAPTLALTSPSNNQTLTENATLNIQGTASDTDKDNVVTIKYRINNGTTRALQSGVSNGSTPISFAKTLTFRAKRLYDGTTDLIGSDLAENTDHTLTIWAEDDEGGKSTEVTRKFRVVHNRPPVINGQNVDLGVLNAIPSKTYTVTEPEGDAFTITEKINCKVIRTFAGTDSKENTATIPLDTWLRLSLTAVHTLTIEATDSKGMTSTRSYTFRRSADKIAFALRNPFGTDIAAKRILVTIDATIPAGADYKAEVCNNAFDELPTWEDASNHVKFNRGFIFTNKEKTAEKWGVSVRFSFTRGTATEPVIVRGFGGAFD